MLRCLIMATLLQTNKKYWQIFNDRKVPTKFVMTPWKTYQIYYIISDLWNFALLKQKPTMMTK